MVGRYPGMEASVNKRLQVLTRSECVECKGTGYFRDPCTACTSTGYIEEWLAMETLLLALREEANCYDTKP